jgi:hypothetical protein
MSSIADLDLSRPSSLLLVAVIAVNLLLPIAHFSSQDVQAAAPARADAAPPALAGLSADESVAQRIQAVEVPVVSKRVALHSQAPVCRAWGPFSELAEAEALAARLSLPGDDFEVFQSRVTASPDYLVTLAVPGPRDAADRAMQELGDQQVESYILDREEAGGVVLAAGVFSAAPRAEARREQLLALGYPAVVEPLDRSRSVYHLLARMPAGAQPEVPALGACGDIAHMQQFL